MKVLVVKLSSLGDVVHTLPVVHDMKAHFPKAEIDWVVESAFAPLVQRCQGVHRVIECEIRRWRRSALSASTRAAFKAFKSELQSQSYDAVIDLQGLSKSALVSWLARCSPDGKRYAMANRTEGSGYEAVTRWVAQVAIELPVRIHALTRGRELCARAMGYRLDGSPTESAVFGLKTITDKGLFASENIANVSQTQAPWVALVHGSSRADKLWPYTHWLALAQRLGAAGYGIALPHGNDAELAEAQSLAQSMARSGVQVRVWPRLELGAMIDALASCEGVIGVDSGPSHMAVALNLPHVQIYNFDTAWRTGPLPCEEKGQVARQRSVFAKPTPTVDAVWQAWQAVTAQRTG